MNFHWLLPTIHGIPVLMYHRVSPDLQDGLTVTPEQLREQWLYLRYNGYRGISLQEYLSIASGKKRIYGKCVLITFDDGYQNNLTYAYPLLQELKWCATFFIIADTLDGTATPETEAINRKLSVTELRSMDPAVVQLALHGYHHENFSEISLEEMKAAIQNSFRAFNEQKVPFEKVLAYPYGARPKRAHRRPLKSWMKEQGIQAAFRIGNKPEVAPSADLFEIKRIDILGEDSLSDFKIKLLKGKLKPF